MTSLKFLLGALAVVGVVVGVALHFLRASSAPRHADTLPAAHDPAHTGGEPNAGASEEVQRLRAELRKRDQMLASLLAQARTASPDAGSAAVAARQTATSHPGDRAIDILDERMVTAPKDPAKVAEMERAIRNVASSPALANAKIASLSCGSTLCKVILTADSGSDINQSMAELGANLPKMFAATAVHRSSDGENAMYLARSRDDLAMTAQ